MTQMSPSLSECYRILEVDRSAADAEVRGAFKILIKVWHPDRHGHDEVLRRRAEEKVKAINEAYRIITAVRAQNTAFTGPSSQPNRPTDPSPQKTRPSRPPPTENQGPTRSRAGSSSHPHSTPPRPPRDIPDKNQNRTTGSSAGNWAIGIACFLVIGVLMVGMSWIKLMIETPSRVQPRTQPASHGQLIVQSNVTEVEVRVDGRAIGSAPLEVILQSGPHQVLVLKRGFSAFVDVVDLKEKETKFVQATLEPMDLSDSTGSFNKKTIPEAVSTPRPPGSSTIADTRQPEASPLADYFFLTSEESAVFACLGKPASKSGNVLLYGKSKIFLDGGRVVGWIDSGEPALPISVVDLAKGGTVKSCIAVGDRLSALIATAGKPNAIIEDKWYFGLCFVTIENGIVSTIHSTVTCSIPLCENRGR